MYNQNIDSLTDYPFDRLRKLLQGLEPPNNLEVLSLSLGEPQHKPPNFVSEIITCVKDKNDKIIEGNPETIKIVNDVWKFSKNMWSQDPTWYLVETSNK